MAGFFIDHNLSPRMAELLRERSQDAVTARDLGLQAVHDGCILMACARAHRIIVTQDHDDFWELHQSWQLWSKAWGVVSGTAPLLQIADASPFPLRHAGIFTLPQVAAPERPQIVQELVSFVTSAGEVENEFYRLDLRLGWQHRPYMLKLPPNRRGARPS